jgi:putative transposase
VLSVSQQCELLGLSRSSFYYEPATESVENLALMALIDKEYTARPFRGSRGMRAWLRQEGHAVNRKRVQRRMALWHLLLT